MSGPRTVWIINIAAERGGATVQAGMQYPEKAQALRVYEQLLDLWSRAMTEGLPHAPHRFIHEMGHTAIVPHDLVSIALMPHVEEQPRNSFGGAVPSFVPDPTPPKEAMIDAAVRASGDNVTQLRADGGGAPT